MRVDAIPTLEYLIATSDNHTPRNGPNREPPRMGRRADLMSQKCNVRKDFSLNKVSRAKMIAAVNILMRFADSGENSPTRPFLAKTKPIDCPTAPPRPNNIPQRYFESWGLLLPLLRSETTQAIPPTVTTIAMISTRDNISPNKVQAINVEMIGTRDISSIDNRAPITENALNRSESPRTSPINPDSPNQNHL